jgi:membrane-associated phospholipid phosphatase
MKKKILSGAQNDEAKNNSGPIKGEDILGTAEKNEGEQKLSLDRRNFLGRALAVGVMAGGALFAPKFLGQSQKEDALITSCGGCEMDPVTGVARADKAYNIRVSAAKYERTMPIPTHPCNGDEVLYQNQRYFASYTKGLKRASGFDGTLGEVDPVEYCKLLAGLASGDPGKIEDVLLGFSNDCSSVTLADDESRLAPDALPPNKQRRLESPQAGLNFDLEGKDYYQLINRPQQSLPVVAFPPAFTFASEDEAVEIIENYWQALTRDVPFINYAFDPTVAAASSDLTSFANKYHGPLVSGAVTPQVYSRGILKGDTNGPFVSQFMLRDVPYGAQVIPAKINSPAPGISNDFMTDITEWRMIQTGQTPNRQTTYDGMRYIRSGRNLSEFVHSDAIYQAYLNAALNLMVPASMGGLGVPINPFNPYNQNTGGYCKQLNFVEFGPSQLLSLLGEVSVRAHKAVWYQKWQVHRRLRPEEFGGCIDHKFNGRRDYPVNQRFFTSSVVNATLQKYGSLFLPQAFPEGSPLHPSYGAGHATLAGACVTILKAWFDSERLYTDFGPIQQSNQDGTGLVSVLSISGPVTVADELNKLASNIAIARNIAGVHWRSDYTESVFLGEQVAIQLLEDYGFTYNEKFDGFLFRDFAGNLIKVGGNH